MVNELEIIYPETKFTILKTLIEHETYYKKILKSITHAFFANSNLGGWSTISFLLAKRKMVYMKPNSPHIKFIEDNYLSSTEKHCLPTLCFSTSSMNDNIQEITLQEIALREKISTRIYNDYFSWKTYEDFWIQEELSNRKVHALMIAIRRKTVTATKILFFNFKKLLKIIVNFLR